MQECSGEVVAHTDEALFGQCGVRIAFTERTGGFSQGPFASLNIKEESDEEWAVESNRKALCAALGCSLDSLVIPRQVHGTTLVELLGSSADEVSAARRKADGGCDGIVVSCPGAGALLAFADCLPLVMVAPSGAFAVVHCGWRGTVAGIASKALARLLSLAQCQASQVNAYIGPYIHEECFEVSGEVAQQFEEAFGAGAGITTAPNALDKAHVNLGRAVRADLCNAGMDAARIADVDICTACSTDRFFSYRAEGGVTGRHGAFAANVRTL